MNTHVQAAISGLVMLLATSAPAHGQEGLLVLVDGECQPASYSSAELNRPGMLCIRYKNYWCVKGSSVDPWRGQSGLDERNHAIFETAAYGARAFFGIMRTYHQKHDLRSTYEIFGRYAPADDCVGSLPRDPRTNECPHDENRTLQYARKVAAALGVGIHDDIGLFDSHGRADFEVAEVLAQGVVQFELGANRRVSADMILTGLAMAGIDPISQKE